MFYKVKNVTPLPNCSLMVQFENNTKKLYDVKPLFKKWNAFKALEYTNGLFEQVKVDAGGCGISWNDDIDLACDELWYNGKPIAAD